MMYLLLNVAAFVAVFSYNTLSLPNPTERCVFMWVSTGSGFALCGLCLQLGATRQVMWRSVLQTVRQVLSLQCCRELLLMLPRPLRLSPLELLLVCFNRREGENRCGKRQGTDSIDAKIWCCLVCRL
ncbi:hypothetical protein M758_UG045900 [Ceratodon purpureus]|nr:hypothetical protein M758_UG045900 [Ceratodon purpureus]